MKALHLGIIAIGILGGISLAPAFADVNASAPIIAGTQFQLKVNQTSPLESDGIKVKLLNVTADSRCPSDVTCIWQGEVKISVNIIRNNQDLGDFSLTSRAGQDDLGIQNFDGHLIQLVKVEPYPTSGKKISKSDYVVTFAVKSTILSPLKQFNSGISANDVKCKEGMQLVIKKKDGSPACVTPQTAQILGHRGWADQVVKDIVLEKPSDAAKSVHREPAPMPITIWGHQDTFDHAKSLADMSWISLPTKVPPNLTLAPIRVKTDSAVTIISAIYTPPGVSTSDNVTGDQVANAGGFSIAYSKEIGVPGVNMTRQMKVVAKEFPNYTSLDIINGHQTIIFPNEMQIYVGNCMGEINCELSIDIGSITYNSTELRSIAQSIIIPPAGGPGISVIPLNSLHSSSTFVSTNSSTGHVGKSMIFKAVVNDTNSGTKTSPIGTIWWDDGGAGGTFGPPGGAIGVAGVSPNSSRCDELNATSDVYECTATYIPSRTGQTTMTASYWGDTIHISSSGSLTFTVS